MGWDFSLALGFTKPVWVWGELSALWVLYITKHTGIESICVGKICRSILITIRNTLDYILRPARKIFRFAPKSFLVFYRLVIIWACVGLCELGYRSCI